MSYREDEVNSQSIDLAGIIVDFMYSNVSPWSSHLFTCSRDADGLQSNPHDRLRTFPLDQSSEDNLKLQGWDRNSFLNSKERWPKIDMWAAPANHYNLSLIVQPYQQDPIAGSYGHLEVTDC